MKRDMPDAYYVERLRVAEIEYDELDRQIRLELKDLAQWSANKVREVEQELLPKTKRIAELRREIAACRRSLP